MAVVVIAAALHAGWNAVVKGGQDTFLTTLLVAASAALVAALVLPWLPAPARASWPYLAASSILQALYFVLVAAVYRGGDMSLAYPLMRGSAPLLVALMSLPVTGETLSEGGWAGLALLCGGVFSLVGAPSESTKRSPRTVSLALLNAVVIAGYTLIDGVGVRLSGAAAAYTLWVFLLTAIPLLAVVAWRQPRRFIAYARQRWLPGLAGGLGTLSSYGLALWAMTQAPIPAVAALRETSIVFATLLAALVFKERIGRQRLLATGLILAGAMLLRLA